MNEQWCNLLKNRHVGQRAVLVCNGPSLSKMDLGFLNNEIVIGLNKIYLGFRKFRFYPKYFVAVNKKVLQQSHREILDLTCIKFLSNHCPEIYHDDALTHIVNTHNPQSYFCTDITTGVHEGWTVTFAALQIAFFLGFDEVVIIGMDHRYTYSGEPNEEQIIPGKDLNHFSDAYFGFGQSWDNPDLEHSEKSYQIANETYKKNDKRIIDATLDGACTIFEKIDYRSVFSPDLQIR
jgi:hypothetical protein